MAYDRWLTRETRNDTELAFEVAAAIDAQHDLSAVASVLELQPVEEVETLLLYAWEHLTYSEIAETLAIPVGTVRSRIHRLRQHLNDELAKPLAISESPQSRLGDST